MRDDKVKLVVMIDRRIIDLGVRMFYKYGYEEYKYLYIF